MLMRRVIVCLDVVDGRVAKGVRFEALRDVGDPATMAEVYEREGADEIVLLDITATQDGRATMLDVYPLGALTSGPFFALFVKKPPRR